MTTWCMCFYFHPVWTAQGHSDECLGITLPDMFAVALHRSDGEADRSLSVMEAVLFLMLYKQLCRPSKHSNPSVLQTGHGMLASSTNTALFHPATHSGWFIQWEHNHWYSMDVYRSRVKSFCCCCARLPGGAGHDPVADHVVSRSETLADELTVPSPRTMACLSCPRLWVGSCWWLLLSSQSCCQSQSELSTAAPERAEPGCKHGVWLPFTQQEWETQVCVLIWLSGNEKHVPQAKAETKTNPF